MDQEERLAQLHAENHQTGRHDDGELVTDEFLKNVKPFQEQKKKSRRRKIILSILLVIVLIGASGYGGYKYLTREVELAADSSQNQMAEQPAEKRPGGTYKSNPLNLEFDYPDGFRVDDDQIRTLAVISEPITVKDEFSEPAQAIAVLFITEESSLLEEYKSDSLSAALDSAELKYISPTDVQRPATRLTFLSVGTSAALDSVIVSGGLDYQAGAPVPYVDLASIVPAIEIRFYSCDNKNCGYKNDARIGIDPTEWQTNPGLQDIESIVVSLEIN